MCIEELFDIRINAASVSESPVESDIIWGWDFLIRRFRTRKKPGHGGGKIQQEGLEKKFQVVQHVGVQCLVFDFAMVTCPEIFKTRRRSR